MANGLVGAGLAKRTFPTVGQQSLRNKPMLAQLLCATWELKRKSKSKNKFIMNSKLAFDIIFIALKFQ